VSKETIGVRLERDVIEAIRKVGVQQDRTLSNMAGVALAEWAAARGLVAKPKPKIFVGAKL
jgi:hypothetical protein